MENSGSGLRLSNLSVLCIERGHSINIFEFMIKKILFLDGDGTTWYPSSTKRTEKPHWVYHDPETKDNYLEHIELAPDIREALLELRKRNVILVLISASPASAEKAVAELREKLEFFNILDLFHSYRSSPGDRPDGKGEIMLEVIDSLGFAKDDALMIGDSFFYDYLAAKNIGVDAFFIENECAKMPDIIPKDLQKIKEVRDILDILV